MAHSPSPPSAADRLPNEILVDIIRDILPSRVHRIQMDSVPEILKESLLPFPLTRVCKHWRNVILSSPCLWTTLSLYILNGSASAFHLYDTSRAKSALSTWLKYSGSSPLTLSMDIYGEHEAHLEEIWGEFSPSLDEFVARCTKISVATHAPTVSLPDHFRQQLEKADRLEILELDIDSSLCGDEHLWAPQAARMLGHLKIIDSNQTGTLTSSVIYKNLQCINYGLRTMKLGFKISCNTVLMLFTHLPNIEITSFTLLTIIDPSNEANTLRLRTQNAGDAIQVPHLHTLTIFLSFGWREHDTVDHSELASYEPFQYFLLPSLQEVSIEMDGSRTLAAGVPLVDAIIRGLATSFIRSEATVKTLFLLMNRWLNGFKCLFDAMPALSGMTLLIENYVDLRDLLDRLQGKHMQLFVNETTPRSRPRMIPCPNLETLKIIVLNYRCRDPNTSVDQLAEFVLMRRDPDPERHLSTSALDGTAITPKHLRKLTIREGRRFPMLSRALLQKDDFKRILGDSESEGFRFEVEEVGEVLALCLLWDGSQRRLGCDAM